MSAKKKKYYVVWQGVNPGIYDNWTDTQLQIAGYPGAKYKSFKTKEAAENAYHDSYEEHTVKKEKKAVAAEYDKTIIKENSICVDAACSGNPGDMEYRAVETYSGVELFKKGPYKRGTNNIGEFLALVHAAAQLKKEGNSKTIIYTDSRTAMAWVRNKYVKTSLKKTKSNETLFRMITRAQNWLKENPIENPIEKWDTKTWGEIPADFGRK